LIFDDDKFNSFSFYNLIICPNCGKTLYESTWIKKMEQELKVKIRKEDIMFYICPNCSERSIQNEKTNIIEITEGLWEKIVFQNGLIYILYHAINSQQELYGYCDRKVFNQFVYELTETKKTNVRKLLRQLRQRIDIEADTKTIKIKRDYKNKELFEKLLMNQFK
jgi:predicted RNA-binding Zn-ribbon protein involved in translation (DUF1610 family)